MQVVFNHIHIYGWGVDIYQLFMLSSLIHCCIESCIVCYLICMASYYLCIWISLIHSLRTTTTFNGQWQFYIQFQSASYANSCNYWNSMLLSKKTNSEKNDFTLMKKNVVYQNIVKDSFDQFGKLIKFQLCLH